MPEQIPGLLSDKEADDLKSLMGTRLQSAKRFWQPLHVRMDYWASMYFMLDVIQQLKPLGYRRFITNMPRTAVDAAVAILTRNESYWRIALMEMAGENMDERRRIGKIERTLQGLVYDLDEMFSMRGQMRFWKQVATQALLRGWIWGKVHITTDALKYREAPVIGEIYDSRQVYPAFDSFGLNHVNMEKPTTMGDLAALYPEKFGDEERNPNWDPQAPALKLEYWSNDRGERKGVMGCLALPIPSGFSFNQATNPDLGKAQWVVPPRYHGYHPQALPVVGVACNGVNLMTRPAISELILDRVQQRARLLGLSDYAAFWQMSSNNWVSESGRSILSSVEEQVPQYNELIATIFQHFSVGTYGTWIFKTPTGELPNFEPGIEAKVAIRPEESLSRAEIGPISPDAYRLANLLQDEQQKGVLSNILQAVVPFQGSGVMFQQIANAALNALEPYHDGLEDFGTRIGTSILAQMQAAAPALKKFSVSAPAGGAIARRQSFFDIEFDPKTDLEKGRRYRPRPVFKPSLPDDLAVRINAARLALDPRRPILSIMSVLENILQVDDPAEEIDRIWADIANTDPVIVLEQVANALIRMNEPELAEQIRTNEFRTKFVQEAQFRQLTGNVPQGSEQPGNMPPETGSPFATQHPGTGQGQEQENALAAEGAKLLSGMGEGGV